MTLPNFANQDLRNRSFKAQDLTGADFSGADIRGCNFRQAVLVGANFESAQVGQTKQQILRSLAVALATSLLVGDAVSRLIFGALGQVPNDPAWLYVLVLYAVLSAAGFTSGIQGFTESRTPLGKLAGMGTAILTGALLGFFYAGIMTGKHPQTAIAGAIVGALLGLFGWLWLRIATVVIAAAGVVMGYGAAFFLGATAIAFLSAQQLGWGILLSLLAILYFWFTLRSLLLLVQEIKTTAGTSFREANLTNANFKGVDLRNTDLPTSFTKTASR